MVRREPTVAFVTRALCLYSSLRLVRALRARGARVLVLRPRRTIVALGPGAGLLQKGRLANRLPDVVLPRLGQDRDGMSGAILEWLQCAGVPALNRLDAIEAARDKFRSLQVLQAGGVPVPASALVGRPGSGGEAVDFVGGPPVVVKVRRGTHGSGVMLAESRLAARALLEHLLETHQPVFVQRFLALEGGRDLRVAVLGGRARAAMWRYLPVDDYRANYHRGARIEAADPGPEALALAERAVSLLGLDLAGVDLLPVPGGGWAVVEVNPTPGFKGLETATGFDLAGAIADRCLELARLSR